MWRLCSPEVQLHIENQWRGDIKYENKLTRANDGLKLQTQSQSYCPTDTTGVLKS